MDSVGDEQSNILCTGVSLVLRDVAYYSVKNKILALRSSREICFSLVFLITRVKFH